MKKRIPTTKNDRPKSARSGVDPAYAKMAVAVIDESCGRLTQIAVAFLESTGTLPSRERVARECVSIGLDVLEERYRDELEEVARRARSGKKAKNGVYRKRLIRSHLEFELVGEASGVGTAGPGAYFSGGSSP